MSPLDQGKYASYLYFHGLLDKAQHSQLDEIDGTILEMIHNQKWLEAWQGRTAVVYQFTSAFSYFNEFQKVS